MKKIFLVLSIFCFSCNSVGKVENFDVIIKKGNIDYKVKRIYLHDEGPYIYVMYPVNDSISIPQQITFQEGKVTTTIVELK